MTISELAAADQAEARERDFDRRAQKVGAWALILGLALGGYSALAVAGDVPAPSWSPIGQQAELPVPDRPVVEIPEGYEPVLPPESQSPPSLDV